MDGFSLVRLFLAIDIPSQIRNQIVRIQNALRETGLNLKLVEAQNIHFTLKFLGETDPSRIPMINTALDTIQFRRYDIHIQGVGCFPNARRPRVIWLGIHGQGIAETKSLASSVNRVLKEIGIPPDFRPFKPHTTIARLRRPMKLPNEVYQKLNKFLSQYENHDCGTLMVQDFHLKESVLTPQGPIYTTRYTNSNAED